MSEKSHISNRGHIASQTELRTDLELFFEAANDLWTKENPGGKFPLNMAENNLSWDLLSTKLESILRSNKIPKWVSNYTGIGGSDEFLDVIANFLEKNLTKCTIDPSHLTSSAGATAVLEVASWVTCDANDVAVIPAPSYPVYTQDIGNKASVERYNLITHFDIKQIAFEHSLSIQHLENAKGLLRQEGKRFKLLILTTPDNPTGLIYSQNQLKGIAEWCQNNKIHLLVNELYGLSKLNLDHSKLSKDYKNPPEFVSFANIMEEMKNPFLHMVYGLSKDFGISGLRVGFFYSMNEEILSAYRNMNAPHMVSNLTQWTILELLKDQEFIDKYIQENQKQLTESFVIVTSMLREIGIQYVHSFGSLFVWLELSHLLNENTSEAEEKLWLDIYKKTGILLTPGTGFGHAKRGQFRLVHSFLATEALEEAMRRFRKYLEN